MCSCNGKRYVVTYPDGTTKTFTNPTSARIAASRVAGATYKQASE